jgi:DNA-binding transcriptional regulator YiaG
MWSKAKIMNGKQPDVKELRKVMGLTQVELAARIGVHKATIDRWEKKMPTGGAARAIIQALWDRHIKPADKIKTG